MDLSQHFLCFVSVAEHMLDVLYSKYLATGPLLGPNDLSERALPQCFEWFVIAHHEFPCWFLLKQLVDWHGLAVLVERLSTG